MRMAQVILATLVILLSIVGNVAAATATTTKEVSPTGSSTLKTTKMNATTTKIEITSKNATATITSLRQFLATELLSRSSTSTEERAGVIASGEGARVGAGGTVVSTSSGGKMVTVTIYNNNGLLQKIQRWWKKLVGGSSSTRRLRQPTAE